MSSTETNYPTPHFFNSLGRRVEALVVREQSKVGLYTCGPTVYDHAHIGNLRSFLFEDILRRSLEFLGYEVLQVMNLTDVDDKTIKGSREAGVALGRLHRSVHRIVLRGPRFAGTSNGPTSTLGRRVT